LHKNRKYKKKNKKSSNLFFNNRYLDFLLFLYIFAKTKCMEEAEEFKKFLIKIKNLIDKNLTLIDEGKGVDPVDKDFLREIFFFFDDGFLADA